MKKKKIEAIPWISPEQKRPGKDILFLTAAGVHRIENEDTLIVDIWAKGKKDMPVLRAAYTRTKQGLFYPQDGTWTRENINGRNYLYDNELKAKALFGKGTKHADVNNTAISHSHIDAIFGFIYGKPAKDYRWRNWIDALRNLQNDIRREQENRKHERKREAMRQRHAATPEIPEGFRKWAESLLAGENFLYYRKKGRRATIRCSRCGGEYEGYTQRSGTFEGQFQHIIGEVSDREWGTCEECGVRGMYRPIGRMKGTYGLSENVYLIQPYQGKDFVIRYFLYEKYLQTDTAEQKNLIEIARTYVTLGKTQTDYHKRSGYCENYWDYCNLYGMNNIQLKAGQIWPGTWNLVKDTRCAYTGLKEFSFRFPELRPVRYIETWKEKPCIEVLAKNDMYLAARLVYDGRMPYVSRTARRPADILGIYPHRVAMVRAEHGEPELIKALRLEAGAEKHFTDEQIRRIVATGIAGNDRTYLALEIMPIQKLLNRIYRYVGADPAEEYHYPESRAALHSVADTYLDYLSMREQLHDDLTDSVIQCPRNLQEAHADVARAINMEKEEKHIREKEAQFPVIRKHYRSLRMRYFWEDGEFIIRPARSAEEIILEGRVLHHCVGGDRYLAGHNQKSNIILFLRPANMAEVPWVTVEIEYQTGDIRQWYGTRDTKPAKKEVDAWLGEYTKMLRKYGSMAAAREARLQTADAVLERLMAPA